MSVLNIEQDISEIKALEQKISETELLLKDLIAKKAAKEAALAERMLENGHSKIETVSGYVVRVKDDVRATWPKERADEAIAWLAARGGEGIVKTTMTTVFEPGHFDEARHIAQEMMRRNIVRECEVAPRVHPQTLWAFFRECLENGTVDDEGMNLFNLFVRKTVSIKEK